MRNGEVTIVDRSDASSFDFLDITAGVNPIGAQRREAALDVAVKIGVGPGAAGVVNADGLVDFELAGHGFRRREGDFAEGDAEIGMELAGEVDFLAVRERCVGGLGFDGVFGCDHSVAQKS